MEDKIKILNNCMRYAGINQQTTKEDYVFLMEFFESQFSNMSYLDLQQAFKANAKKDFHQVEAYQNFSPMLIGKVINAYKEEKRKQKLINPIIAPERMIEDKVDPAAERKRSYEFIEKVYKQEGKFPVIASWSDAYLYLESEGKITMTLKEKEELAESIKTEVNKEINFKRVTYGFKDANLLNSIRPSNLKIECRRRAVIDYLKKL